MRNTQPRLLQSANWLGCFPDCIGPDTSQAFCDRDVFMDSDKFETHCTPRFQELFNSATKYAHRVRTSGVPEMAALASRFDAENAVKPISEAIKNISNRSQSGQSMRR